MPRIVVSDRAYEMLMRLAHTKLRETARRLDDGRWEVSLSDELHALLTVARFLDEPISQTVLRILPTRTGGGR